MKRRRPMKISTKSTLKITELTAKHEKSAITLFVKSFCDSEPITKHLAITPKDYIPFATEVVKKAIKDKVSIIILDSKNKVVGLIIAEDLSDPFKPNLSNYPKLQPICALLEKLTKKFTAGKKFIKGKVLHTWVAAIDPKYRSQGLYTEVGLAHVESAMKKGFDFIYSDFTNELSEKIVRNFPVQLCNAIHLNDFEYSYKPFEGLEGEASSYVTPVKPNIKLDSLEKCYTLTVK